MTFPVVPQGKRLVVMYALISVAAPDFSDRAAQRAANRRQSIGSDNHCLFAAGGSIRSVYLERLPVTVFVEQNVSPRLVMEISGVAAAGASEATISGYLVNE